VITAKRSGVVESVDAARIVISRRRRENHLRHRRGIYNMTKYQRTNQDTCSTTAIVTKGSGSSAAHHCRRPGHG